jgi:hypothetical protein
MGSRGSIQASFFVFNFPNLGDKFSINLNLWRIFFNLFLKIYPSRNSFIHNQNIPSIQGLILILNLNVIQVTNLHPWFGWKIIIHKQTLKLHNFHIQCLIGVIFKLLNLSCGDLEACKCANFFPTTSLEV